MTQIGTDTRCNSNSPSPTDTDTQVHWHILGVGAMGGLYAHRLAALNQRVTLLKRYTGMGDSIDDSSRQLTLTIADQSVTRTFTEQSVANSAPIQNLLVTTKSFDVVDAIKSVRGRLTPDTVVVILVNGMGYHREVAELIAPARIIAGTTTSGCHQPNRNTRIQAGFGETRLGWLDQSTPDQAITPPWFKAWETAEWPCFWEADIETAMIRKLAVNAVINPLTALNNVVNGDLLRPPLRAQTDSAIQEVQALLHWSGHHDIAAALSANVIRVIEDTALNISSMRSDLMGQRRTEIDAILGYLLDAMTPCREETPKPATPILSDLLKRLRQQEPDRE